jgi:lipoyl synthase
MNQAVQTARLRKPEWLRVRLGGGPRYRRIEGIIRGSRLHTVCDEALCPNKGTCWENGRATVMILGDACTRRCAFCNVAGAKSPTACDPDEPRRVADAARAMGLADIVITSVTRDDLPDGGAAVWAETIRRVHAAAPGIIVEALVPDFNGDDKALEAVLRAGPEVFGHNLEMAPSLYARVRPQADYARSLRVLKRAADAGLVAKTGVMVGLGETAEEVQAVMADARAAGCRIFFAGQYLQPTREHWPVQRYVEPSEFEAFKKAGLALGFAVVVSAPLVRSSFHSAEQTAFVATPHAFRRSCESDSRR